MQAVFGGLIAVILLGIYIRLIIAGSLLIHCSTHSCKSPPVPFNDEMSFALSTIGGLVSALVIAELAITRPGQAIGARLLAANPTPGAATVVKLIAWVYVLAWVISGCWIFVITMYHPYTVPVLTSTAHAWVGLAVAAAYAYFGLQRQ